MTKKDSLLVEILSYAVLIAILCIPFAVLIGLLIWFSHAECNTFAVINPDFDVMWVRYHGCMVKYNGMYIPVNDVVNVLQGR